MLSYKHIAKHNNLFDIFLCKDFYYNLHKTEIFISFKYKFAVQRREISDFELMVILFPVQFHYFQIKTELNIQESAKALRSHTCYYSETSEQRTPTGLK